MESMLDMFIYENNQLTDRLEELLLEADKSSSLDSENINEIFRIMHTIKGSSAMMEYEGIAELAHSVEDMFFFIRENPDEVNPDWPAIIDIVFSATDFFKAEADKISSRLPADGDNKALLDTINAYLPILKASGSTPAPDSAVQVTPEAPAADTETVTSDTPESETPDTDTTKNTDEVPAAIEASGEQCCVAKIFFEDGCKMENIRAFQIVNALIEAGARVESFPKDLLEDVSEDIITNGVTLYIYSPLSIGDIKTIIAESIFVKSLEIAEADASVSIEDHEESDEDEIEDTPASEIITPKPAENIPPVEKKKSDTAPTAPNPAPATTPTPTPAPARQTPAPAAAKQASDTPKQSYISVSIEKLDRLLELVGEIVIAEAMVTKNPDLGGLNLPNFESAASMLRKNNDELKDLVMSVRMIPVSSTFHKMSRIVRDLSKKVNKQVELVIKGEETELDKNIIDNLSDPLMHIVRNSMDHGLEDTTADRVAAGKPETGVITLEARNAGSDVVISINDDGRGLNKEKILDKARNQGILTKPESEYSDKEIYNLIMLPGFSTKEQVTELSGRGVGMDVVKKNIEKIGGAVYLDSIPGQGMTVNIKIPLTLAILDGMEISVGDGVFIVPILNIRQTIKPSMSDVIVDPEGNEMFMVRGEVYPIVRLHRMFGVYDESHKENFDEGIIMVCEDEDKTICIFCDGLLGEQQVVIKPFPTYISMRMSTIRGISGCTILGNGNISLIIDIKGLFD